MVLPTGCSLFNFEGVTSRTVDDNFWLKNKHTITIFRVQVGDLAKHFEAQPKKHNAFFKKTCMLSRKLHLGEITIFAFNGSEARFWEKHFPAGPVIYCQYFCFVVLKSSAKD